MFERLKQWWRKRRHRHDLGRAEPGPDGNWWRKCEVPGCDHKEPLRQHQVFGDDYR